QSVALAVGGNNSNSTPPRANRDNPPAKGDREELFCNYCKKTNHVIKDCWRLKKKKQDRENAENAGRFAGSVGQNIGSEEGSQTEGLHIEVGNRFASPVGGFTAEEMSRLRSILQMSNSTSPTSPQSPVINHRAHSVTTHLPAFPNSAGPDISQDDWFGSRN
ncbi:unnamed protein product, partial [Linum tenue]